MSDKKFTPNVSPESSDDSELDNAGGPSPINGAKKGTNGSSGRSTPFVFDVKTLQHLDIINAEQTLQRLGEASTELVAYESEDMEGHTGHWDSNRSCQMHYADFMKNFRQSIGPALAFLGKLPAYSAVPGEDRCLLFSQSLLPFVFTQLCLPVNSEYAFFGFNKFNRDLCLKAFPEYELFAPIVEEICEIFKTWQPTKVEVSLLLAFLFYQTELLDKVKHQKLIASINARLKAVLYGVVNKHPDDERLRHFMHAYEVIRETPSICSQVSKAVYHRFSNENFPTDELFIEIYVNEPTFDRSRLAGLVSASTNDFS